jgi:hypothetical protein
MYQRPDSAAKQLRMSPDFLGEIRDKADSYRGKTKTIATGPVHC